MNWKLVRVDIHKGFKWNKIGVYSFYDGNQKQLIIGKVALVFERRKFVDA